MIEYKLVGVVPTNLALDKDYAARVVSTEWQDDKLIVTLRLDLDADPQWALLKIKGRKVNSE